MQIYVVETSINYNGYEYMDSWEQFDEMSLFDKKSFYSCLNMENITDFDNRHVKRAYQKFKRKNSGKNHALHVQSDTLLLIDVFENFWNKCTEIYKLHHARFSSAPGLAWETCLKKIEIA